MNASRRLIPTLTVGLALLSLVGCANFDYEKLLRPYRNPNKTVNTLIVIGNRRKPRLLADLIQAETRQPILSIPADSDGKIFFIPVKDTTVEVEFDNLRDFIKYLHPRKILVLGDERYVSNKYLEKIDPSQTVIRVTNRKWSDIAAAVDRILNLTYIEREYKRAEEELESGKLYRPSGPPAENDLIETATDTTPDETVTVETDVSEVVVGENDVVEPPAANKSAADSTADNLPEPELIDESKVVPK